MHHIKLVVLYGSRSNPKALQAQVMVPAEYGTPRKITVPLLKSNDYYLLPRNNCIRILNTVYTTAGEMFRANQMVFFKDIKNMLYAISTVPWKFHLKPTLYKLFHKAREGKITYLKAAQEYVQHLVKKNA